MADVVPRTATAVRPSRDRRADAFAERFSQARVDRAFRFAAAVLGGSSIDAQDAVQEAALRAWSRWGDLRNEAAFDAWFDRILVNVCRDRLRSQRRVVEIRAEPAGRSRFRLDGPLGVLSESFDRLGPDHKLVIVLRFVDDLTLQEIARRTGLKPGTVKSRLHYAVQELRANYDAVKRGEQERGI